MTAPLQTTPAPARNPLGLALLVGAGSRTTQLLESAIWPDSGLAATLEHHLPRPVQAS